MKFRPTKIEGVFLLEPDRHEDPRGDFIRIWCVQEAQAHGLDPGIMQCSISRNLRKATIRGLHFQAPPFAEAKTVRCLRGRIFDVVVDLRPGSATHGAWEGHDLSAENRLGLHIPKGCAHGFQTLVDDSDLLYTISELYHPAAARGVRWNDPAFGIAWPLPDPILSTRDAAFPDFHG